MSTQAPRIPEIIAHRGASHDAPENTIAAAQLAWAHSADALECDVHLTRDRRLAVIHDDDLERVAGSATRVADATLEELQRFDAGGWKHASFRGGKIPDLSEILATVPPAKRVFVELKGGPRLVPELARYVVRAAFDARRLVVISFTIETVQAAKRFVPNAEACWVVERPGATAPIVARAKIEQLVRTATAARLDGLDLDCDWPVDRTAVQRVHAAGLKLYVWTVDDPDVAWRLAGDGVDGITTNRPGWLREQLRLRAGR